MSTSIEEPVFIGLRARLWPIHNYELKKFLPLGLIAFCLVFNYTLLRNTKDVLIVNEVSASIIPILKAFCVGPASLFFIFLYMILTSIVNREKIFYIITIPLILFFGAFGLIIYSNIHAFHPDMETIKALKASNPSLSDFFDLYAYWAYSLFYVLSDIWGNIVASFLFWQFANYVVSMTEAKRFYLLFSLFGSVSMIISGRIVVFCSSGIKKYFETSEEAFAASLKLLMAVVVIIGLITVGLYRWMHTNVLNDERYFDQSKSQKKKKQNEKISFFKSFKMIFQSKELRYIAILLLAYGIAINLIEVQWKNQLKLFCAGQKGLYTKFMGNYSSFSGLFTLLFGFFAGTSILQRCSWLKTAMIAPIVFLLGGSFFFAFICAKDLIEPFLTMLHLTPVSAATYLGAFIIMIAKSIKYAFFNTTREMVYIPLDDELQTKGKAVIYTFIGEGRFGGALTNTGLLSLFKTKNVLLIAAPAFFTYSIICLVWIWAVKMLSQKIEEAKSL